MMTRRIKYLLVAMSALLFPLCLQAQEDNTFGGWEFLEVYHDFGKSPVFASVYFEHDNFQYKRLDNWYIRTTAGVKILPWLKWKKTRHYIGGSYDFSKAVQLETNYIYYTFNNRPAQHVLGIGLNFTI